MGKPANQTPWEGVNQHHAFEDAQWVDQAGSGVDYDAGAGGLVEYAEDSTGERGALLLDSRLWTLDSSYTINGSMLGLTKKH